MESSSSLIQHQDQLSQPSTKAQIVVSGTQQDEKSYLFLRTGVGIIGVALPIVLILGKILLESPGISDSISDYYYSVMRDVLVGSLWAIGIFLICYRYDRLDDIASTLAGVCAIGVALFPTYPDIDATQQQLNIGIVHALFAASFFTILALMTIFLFRRTDQQERGKRKRQRDTVYLICGIVILVCVVLSIIVLFAPFLQSAFWLWSMHPIFFLEASAIFAFGFAWFVKGGLLLFKDK